MSMQASPRASRTAARHDSAVELRDIIVFLNENLGSRLLALTVGVNHRTVGRWLESTDREIRFDTETKLRAAYQVFQAVLLAEAPSTVRAWFMGMNPQLDDRSPAEAIADGDFRGAMAAARAFLNAG